MGYRIKNKHYMNLQYIVIYIRENWKKLVFVCFYCMCTKNRACAVTLESVKTEWDNGRMRLRDDRTIINHIVPISHSLAYWSKLVDKIGTMNWFSYICIIFKVRWLKTMSKMRANTRIYVLFLTNKQKPPRFYVLFWPISRVAKTV